MRSTFHRLFLALAAGAVLVAPHVASAQHHGRHVPQISLEAARATALARVAGEVRHYELEFENHRWIYSFEIKAGRPGIEEVNVDADTGAVVEVVHERS